METFQTCLAEIQNASLFLPFISIQCWILLGSIIAYYHVKWDTIALQHYHYERNCTLQSSCSVCFHTMSTLLLGNCYLSLGILLLLFVIALNLTKNTCEFWVIMFKAEINSLPLNCIESVLGKQQTRNCGLRSWLWKVTFKDNSHNPLVHVKQQVRREETLQSIWEDSLWQLGHGQQQGASLSGGPLQID